MSSTIGSFGGVVDTSKAGPVPSLDEVAAGAPVPVGAGAPVPVGAGAPVPVGAGAPAPSGAAPSGAVAAAPEAAAGAPSSATFFSTATATRTLRPPGGMTRPYHPKQRSSLPASEGSSQGVPSGWKADPTGRHQFRYWDGSTWTENVADAGVQSRDAVSS